MKKVFNTGEVAHIWASQQQNEGRNPFGNVYFEGNTIFSYGSHFPMATIWDKDSNIVFVNSSSYSSTTSGHQSYVRSAINHKTIVECPECDIKGKGGIGQHEKNIKFYLSTIEELIEKQKKARTRSYMREIGQWLDHFQKYSDLFPVRSLMSKDEKILLTICDPEQLFTDCDFTQLREKRAKRETAKQIKKQKERLFSWLGYKVPYKKDKVYLRYNETNETIETTMSANVPVKEAKILYLRIKSGKDIKGFKIGYYTVISMNGELKIGCHNIERNEIDRIANLLSWNV